MDFTVEEMLQMQRLLQEKYQDRWEPISVETGKNKLLWMISEVGEVIDIIKKNGAENAAEDPELRHWLVEELSDVMMFLADFMLCFDITSDELKEIYVEKHERNMNRW